MSNPIPSPFENLLGLQVEESTPGHSRISLHYKTELTNFLGVIHGGVLASLCDAAAVQALQSLGLEGPFLTRQLSVKYRKPAQTPSCEAEAKARHLKAQFFVCDVIIYNSARELICAATVKCYLPNHKS